MVRWGGYSYTRKVTGLRRWDWELAWKDTADLTDVNNDRASELFLVPAVYMYI